MGAGEVARQRCAAGRCPLISRRLAAGLGAWLAAGVMGAPPATTRLVASGLEFPVAIVGLPGDPDHLLVLERAGRVRVVRVSTGEIAPTLFLDFSSAVCCTGPNTDGGAQGLGLAPAFATSHQFYLCFTAAGTRNSTVVRYTVSADPYVADATSLHPVLWFPHPDTGHSGGWIGFRPTDGMLYISSGDGGYAFDPDPVNA